MTDLIATTDRTLAETFGWETPEERLYRECPTAFWLAPDGDGVLPPPPAGPVMPPPPEPTAVVPLDVAPHVTGMTGGILRALLVAGPTFAATALMLTGAGIEEDWWNPIGRALVSLVAVPLTVPFGGILALLPVLIGVLSLGEAGTSFPALRQRRAWALTGGAMGLAIAALFDAGGAVGLALVATSIACAVVARGAVDWIEPQYA